MKCNDGKLCFSKKQTDRGCKLYMNGIMKEENELEQIIVEDRYNRKAKGCSM